MVLVPLENPIRNYAWGSTEFLAQLQGRTPTGQPEAELWMGAHPEAPSRVQGQPLGEWLGAPPSFLLKILAAAEPLSLQAHPTLEQAQNGYRRENEAGVPVKSPQRNYRDPNHKPELITALGPFVALCGFRPCDEIRRRFLALDLDALNPCLDALEAQDLALFFHRLMTLPGREVVAQAVARRLIEPSEDPAARWVLRLAEKYPGDIGILSPFYLNLIHLSAGEGLYLPAGELHAYLHGNGVELMACSDNVLRGGLTPKHVDVPELLSVLNFRPRSPPVLRPEPAGSAIAWYSTPAREFELGVVRPGTAEVILLEQPELWLVTEGELRVQDIWLRPGQAAWATAGTRAQLLPPLTLYRARPNTRPST